MRLHERRKQTDRFLEKGDRTDGVLLNHRDVHAHCVIGHMIVRVRLEQSREFGCEAFPLSTFQTLQQPIDGFVQIGPQFGDKRFLGGFFLASSAQDRRVPWQAALLVLFPTAARAGIVSSDGAHNALVLSNGLSRSCFIL